MDYSISDIASVLGGNRDDGGLFGGGYGGILALIIIFVLLFGNGGWGNNRNNATEAGQFATQADIQRGFDTSTITSKLDGITNGLCDSTFALNNTMVNGFNNVGMAISQLGYQNQQCCCETNRNIDALRYENAKNTCDIINAGHNDTQRIIDTITNNTIQELRCW